MAENDDKYRALVVDSGPIIRLTGQSALANKAHAYYTVPAVLQEIRDSKARHHLEQLPFELVVKEASPEGIQAVVNFSRQTGDYESLSSVDLQVLGLLYDLEREGCQDMSHVRTTPKRTLGVGRIESLTKEEATKMDPVEEEKKTLDEDEGMMPVVESSSEEEEEVPKREATPMRDGPKSWAMLVNPTAAASPVQVPAETKSTDKALCVTFGSINVTAEEDLGGQFSDAEEDGLSSNDGEQYADSDAEISDEECDVYILDPEEAEERKAASMKEDKNMASIEEELQYDFPSLAASLLVPCEQSDEENNEDEEVGPAVRAKQEAERRKQEALRPVTKSGKLYNSFRKYGDLMKPKEKMATQERPEASVETSDDPIEKNLIDEHKESQSRIIGGMAMSGQGAEVEDDGEGWITSPTDIRKMKAAGLLSPTHNPGEIDKNTGEKAQEGPPISQRAACTTTDFAMQNVILQMNLELLSVDGIKVRRLKSWVTRCGACFTVFTEGDHVGPVNTKRLFCARCGSDMLQRVAASLDGKTGRLRLHLSKKYKNNLRGTKFSLPKPGTGNRFQGDLLLREDQLLMGAWNQKAKQRSGGKARASAQSMFGSDLASTVGCNAASIKNDDIRVGFGRRNPNASKFGRERRGKKKKSADKACGLRRY